LKLKDAGTHPRNVAWSTGNRPSPKQYCRHCVNRSLGLTRPGTDDLMAGFLASWIVILRRSSQGFHCASVTMSDEELPTNSCGYSSGFEPDSLLSPFDRGTIESGFSPNGGASQAQ